MPEQDEADIQPQSGEQSPADDPPTAIAQPDQDESGAAPLLLSATNPGAQPDDAEPDSEQPDAEQSDAAQPVQDEHVAAPPEPDDLPLEPAEPLPPVKESRRLSRAERDTVDRQRRRFAACGRCGYFIADCHLYLGDDGFHDALLDARDGWVRMEGDRTFHQLVMDAYGVELDTVFDSLDGTCPECRRRFVLANTEAGPTRLKLRT